MRSNIKALFGFGGSVPPPASSSTPAPIKPRDKNEFFKEIFGRDIPNNEFGEDYSEAKAAFIQASQHDPTKLAINSRKYVIGKFSTPTLKECRDELIKITSSDKFKKIPIDSIKLMEDAKGGVKKDAKKEVKMVGGKDSIPPSGSSNDAYAMHVTESEGTLFQAASQFNALEFVNAQRTPEDGISCYIHDPTQGPACAIACAPGLALRNYLAKVKDGIVDDSADQKGQTKDNQINFLVTAQGLLRKGVGDDTTQGDFFVVKNGYVESTDENLKKLNELITSVGDEFKQLLKDAIRAGIHRDTEVTADPNSTDDNPKLVNQIYVSALSVGYSSVKDKSLWESMARICLEAAYEHTLIEGLRNNAQRILDGKFPQKIMLTKVGGGVFGNQPQWIEEAMIKAIKEAGSYGIPFEVELVHYDIDDANRYYGAGKATKGSLEKAIEEANDTALAKIEERRRAEADLEAAAREWRR